MEKHMINLTSNPRSEKHDAYYDEYRDIWLEPKCSDKKCEFCSDRPDKPSEVNITAIKH